MGDLDELLADGGCAGSYSPVPGQISRGPDHGAQVDTGMSPEALVLRGQSRPDQFARYFGIVYGAAEVTLFRADHPQGFSSAICKNHLGWRGPQ